MSDLEIPDLSGKTILVTGGNAGIGEATVLALAAEGPTRIYVCSRKTANAETLCSSIRKTHPKVDVRILQLDLASFSSIKACAAAFNKTNDTIDLLFLNAGVANVPQGLTKDGYEIQFGVNHVGHALFTQLLMPKLQQAARAGRDVRIILTASGAANAFLPKTTLALSQMQQADAYSTMTLYSHSKLANVLFARKLAKVYPEITTTSAHPGFVKSDIWTKGEQGGILNLLMKPILWVTGVDCEQGAKSQLWCGVTERGGKNGVQNGGFYFPVGKIQKRPQTDQKFADELWHWTNAELERHGGPGWP